MILLNWIKIILEINKYLQNQFYFKVWTYISSVLVLIVNLYVYLYLPVKVFFVLLSPLDDVLKVRGQNEGHSLPLYVQLGLEVTQKMAKVNVEKLREKKKDYILMIKHKDFSSQLLKFVFCFDVEIHIICCVNRRWLVLILTWL